jgi:methionyl-tRNA formyltransferase
MKIGLMIVGSRGLYILKNMNKRNIRNIDVKFVVTYEDQGTTEWVFSDIADVCKRRGIEMVHDKQCPKNLLKKVDKVLVIGWQYLIKGQLSKYIVFHDSFLPEKKGWAPTVSYLLEGSPYLAATAFRPTKVMDEGPVYAMTKRPIEHPMKIADALQLVSEIYLELIKKICKNKMMRPLPESYWREQFKIYDPETGEMPVGPRPNPTFSRGDSEDGLCAGSPLWRGEI